MIDTRMFYIGLDADALSPNAFTALTLFHDEGFIAQNGEGWTPVSHQIVTTESGPLLTVMCNREVNLE